LTAHAAMISAAAGFAASAAVLIVRCFREHAGVVARDVRGVVQRVLAGTDPGGNTGRRLWPVVVRRRAMLIVGRWCRSICVPAGGHGCANSTRHLLSRQDRAAGTPPVCWQAAAVVFVELGLSETEGLQRGAGGACRPFEPRRAGAPRNHLRGTTRSSQHNLPWAGAAVTMSARQIRTVSVADRESRGQIGPAFDAASPESVATEPAGRAPVSEQGWPHLASDCWMMPPFPARHRRRRPAHSPFRPLTAGAAQVGPRLPPPPRCHHWRYAPMEGVMDARAEACGSCLPVQFL